MSNAFACLNSDSEDDEEIKQVLVQEEFPQLCAAPTSISAPKNYASALAYIAPAPEPTIFKAIEKPVAQKEQKKVSQVRPPWALNDEKIAKINWAAWDTDSEEEEEDKTEYIYMTDAQYNARMHDGQYDDVDDDDDW